MSSLAFDIGGTNLRIARIEDGALGPVEKVPTPADPAAGVALMRDFIARQGFAPSAAIGGIAGTVRDGVVGQTTYLPAWDGFDLAGALKAAGIPAMRLSNDAELAGVGEAVRGAGQGYRSVAFVTVSTGLGGALLVDGRPVPHAVGFEPGKQIIDYEHMQTLQGFVSGGALAAEFGHSPEELPPEVFTERTRPLAAGLYNLLRLWSPDVLVVGGPMMNAPKGYDLRAVAREIAALPVPTLPLPPIVPAALGDSAGLEGAAVLASD